MKIRRTFTLIAALVSVVLGGVVATQPVAAQDVCEERDISAFSRIDIKDTGALNITQGDTPSLTVCVATDEEDWLANILTEVDGETLDIEQGAGVFAEIGAVAQEVGISYEVTVPSLTQIDAAGLIETNIDGFEADSLTLIGHQGATFNIAGLSAEALEVDLHDSAEATVTGTATTLTVDTDDGARANLLDLEATTGTVNTLEASVAAIRFVESLTGEAHSFSTVEAMTESGTLDVETSLLGQVITLSYEPLSATPSS